MKRIKMFGPGLIVLVLLLSAGCSKKEAAPGTAAAAQESGYSGKIVIDVHNFLNNEAFVRAIDEVQTRDKYKNLEFEVANKDEEYETTLPIKIASGKQVDIVAIFNPILQAKFADAGVIVPLNEYAEAARVDYKKEFGPFEPAAVNNGQYHTIPHGTTKWVLFYNKKIFDDAGIAYPDPDVPMTWAAYRDLAARLTSGAGSDKVYGALHMFWPMYWYGEAIMKLGGGEQFYAADGTSNIEDPAFRQAMEATFRMQHEDKSIPTHADLVANKIPPQAFFNGNYGMFLQGPWLLNWAIDRETYPRDWELGMTHMPVDAGRISKTWGVANGLAIPPTSADPQLAFEIALDITRTTAKYSATEPMATQSVPQTDLYVGAGEILAAEGLNAQVIQKYFLVEDQIFVTEKVHGPNSARYDQVIGEEVEKYFVREQDLDRTIANIKKRGDEVIAGE